MSYSLELTHDGCLIMDCEIIELNELKWQSRMPYRKSMKNVLISIGT
jgi:hypothetical protein